MRTRLLGLLASTSLILSSAAHAEPAPVALALFRPVEVSVDAVLLAVNLADVDPAVVWDTDQCEYDALNGRPVPAAVLSLEPAGTARVAPDAEHQQALSTSNPDTVVGAHAIETAASSTSDQSTEPAEATGSISAPATPVLEVGPDYGPDELASTEGEKSPDVREAHSDPLPSPEVTESLSVSGVNPPATHESNQDSDIILP